MLLFVMAYILSARQIDKDTAIKVFPEIQIEADKYVFEKEKKFTSYSEIGKSQINRENPVQISQLLSNEPGVFIKDYGGLGGIKTISLRGTSSQQTLVLIEGMKFNSTQNSTLDFSVIPVSMLQSVDILRGGSSAIFGGSSIGGTVNFNIAADKENLITANAGIGSFGEFSTSFSSSLVIYDNVLSISAEYLNSKGNYPFTTQQFGETIEYKRDNADFENFNLMLNSLLYSDSWLFKIIALGRLSERGSPGPVLLGYVKPNDARLKEQEGNIIFKAENETNNGLFKAGALFRYNNTNYWDSESVNALRGDTNSTFISKDIQLNAAYLQEFGIVETNVGIETEYFDLAGDFIQSEINNFADRFAAGFYVRMFMNLIENGNIEIPLQLGGRYDMFTDVAGSPSGVLGLAFNFKEANIKIKSQTAYNYRPPSFNEMYYLNYGNTDLMPEKSFSFNTGIIFEIPGFHTEINGFIIDTKDQIIAVPKSPLTWSAQNMASVLSRGIEFVADGSFFDELLNYRISYTLQSTIDNDSNSETAGKQVVYVPQEMFSAKAGSVFSGFYIGAVLNYTGFTFAMPDNAYQSLIPSFWLIDSNISKDIFIGSSKFILKFDIINILNTQYMVIKNYPMPGRIIRLGLTYELL